MWIVTSLILMLAALVFSLQFRPVQTYFAQRAAAFLSGELKTRVEISGLYLKPFKSLVLEGFYIQDLDEDTLLYAKELSVDINVLSIKNRRISVNTARLDHASFYLKKYKNKTSNLSFIINYFNTGEPEKKDRKPYDITFDKIVLNEVDFRYLNQNATEKVAGVDFNDLGISHLKVTVLNLDTKNHLAKAELRGLSFHDKSGFYLKNLSTLATVDSNKMEFKDLLLVTPKTIIRNYFVMKFRSFDDFDHFNNRVYMEAHFKNSRVLSTDVAYFAPELHQNYIDVKLNGNIGGYVKYLKAKRFSIQSGDSTLLKGDFTIKGLPRIKETVFDLNFDQLVTTKKDYDQILRRITGNDLNRLPDEMGRMGKIVFTGHFRGFTHDFETAGELNTDLGKLIADVKLKRDAKNVPLYEGVLEAENFNIGQLLAEKDLGYTSFKGEINGRGFQLAQLENSLDLTIDYLDYNHYRYQNVLVKGQVNQRIFDGNIRINDPNVALNFTGQMDLNPDLPIFNFDAQIQKADLFALHFSKDTIQVDGKLHTNFSGNKLENIQGEILAQNFCLNKSGESHLIDSVYLVAAGSGNERSIVVKSDLLDGSLKGRYDLMTLPSYFKSVIKKYVPSLQTKIVAYKPQNFELNLNLKRFDPIGLFVNKLKIPEGAVLNGKFASDSNVSTISAYAKNIQYEKYKANNLIVDETTEEKQMNIFVTSDRLDLSDSIFVKNINIANILRNDSLSLNIKLSDKDATNQLDLNGLVEFNGDSLARLNILPSDLVINREVWKIQEKVKIGFDQGKTIIENFGLSRNEQVITVNGVISSSTEDELKVGFSKFNLSTINPLTKPGGLTLKGELNGQAGIRALSGKMRLSSDLKIDSLHFNNNFIGDLNLDADFDNESKLAAFQANIIGHGIKTLDIHGTYDADPKQNELDLDVKLNNNPIVMLEPILKNLVSELNGTISSDLKVTGKPANPKVNGTITLTNTSMKVNYLKTTYRITQKLKVNNTIIDVNDLRIKDINNNEALANGTVDMRNPDNPTINVTLVTNNFMALNTTPKDNSAYYGTAYGTGFFSFDGPTDNMNINIDAKTEAGTIFNIPLNSTETIGENDFIFFTGQDSIRKERKENFFKGLTMNFSLNVDEASQANIFTSLGRLSGRGKGDLSLKISSLGDFEMFGDYLISQGKFEFTAKDYINKVFDITQGGSIRWTGDPTGATINLKAAYGVRTSLEPLYTAAGVSPNKNRVQVEAVMDLSGSLLKPDISFDLNFPTDSYVKDQLQGYLNDVNNVNQQALSLIVRRSFAPGNGTNTLTNQINSTVLSAGTELAFNQLNNILTQSLNLNFVDFNIRSFNEASASFRLLNNRLILTGGVTDKRNSINEFDVIGNNIASDVEAQYLIKKDGSLVLRASKRLSNQGLSITNVEQEYVNAIGLVYRRDFDNFGEFLRQLIGKERKANRLKEAEAKARAASSNRTGN